MSSSAAKLNEQVLIHTPHLHDKYPGTRMILDMLEDFADLEHTRVCVDHVEEHTIRHVVGTRLLGRNDASIPRANARLLRAADYGLRCTGPRLLVNSAGDWGLPSRPRCLISP